MFAQGLGVGIERGRGESGRAQHEKSRAGSQPGRRARGGSGEEAVRGVRGGECEWVQRGAEWGWGRGRGGRGPAWSVRCRAGSPPAGGEGQCAHVSGAGLRAGQSERGGRRLPQHSVEQRGCVGRGAAGQESDERRGGLGQGAEGGREGCIYRSIPSSSELPFGGEWQGRREIKGGAEWGRGGGKEWVIDGNEGRCVRVRSGEGQAHVPQHSVEQRRCRGA